ncbi:MAG: tetratricopeptide repeat protein [Rhodospirillales bacterium]
MQVSPAVHEPLQNAMNLFDQGQLGPAEQALRAVLRIEPTQPIALNLLGIVALRTGNRDAAKRLFAQSGQSAPGFADAHNNLGSMLLEGGEIDEAEAAFRRAIEANPALPMAHTNLALILLRRGDAEVALRHCDKAIKADASNPDAHNARGLVLQSLGEPEKAVACFEKAVELNPRHGDALNNLTAALRSADRLAEAERAGERALELMPGSVLAMTNLGVVLRCRGELEKSESLLRRAVEADPGFVDARDSLGNTLSSQGRHAEALACHKAAIAAQPDNPVPRTNAALIELLQSDFANGFADYESRLDMLSATDLTGRRVEQMTGATEWQGDALADLSVLVWGEQGIGDQILFASLLGELAARAGQVSLLCEPRLVPLLARSYPIIEAIPLDAASSIGERSFDRHVALGSLFRWMRADPETVPPPKPFLAADPTLTERCRERYRKHGSEKLVGLAWRSAGSAYSSEKSIARSDLAAVLAADDATFVNLQYGDVADDLAFFRSETGVSVVDDPEIDQMASLDDFAAQVAAMDAVVTISNTTAHVAGGLGVPTVLMLGHAPLWYWQLGRDDSLWYPGIRIVRQDAPGDWSDVASGAAESLRNLTADPASRG